MVWSVPEMSGTLADSVGAEYVAVGSVDTYERGSYVG